jgi:bilirubin oxidase
MNKVILGILTVISIQFTQAQNQLFIPDTLAGPTFDLNVGYDSIEFVSGSMTQTAGVNGPILGPTLIINKGEEVFVNVTNNLIDTTTMHWHGVHLPSEMDGGPHSKIAPNSTWNASWTGMDRASTMWYHPHLHHTTYKHVMLGVAGMIINRDTEESELDLPRSYGVDDIPLIIQTKVLDAEHQIDASLACNAMDTMLLVNGTLDAYHNAPAQLIRFRILNGSAMRAYNIGLSNNANFWVIGSDGGLLEVPVENNRLLMAPAERYEILVDLEGLEGETIQIINYGAETPTSIYGSGTMMGGGTIPNYNNNPLNGSNFPILTLNVQDPSSNPVYNMPSSLVQTSYLDVTNVDEVRDFTFTSTGGSTGPFLINGNTFDMSQINHIIPINNTEIWSFTNQTPIAHPFHIHDVQFNIIEINGNAPAEHMRGWKDVMLIPGHQGTAKFITKFEDFTDPEIPFMYHCHMLVHEDEGMMGQFIVVEKDFDIPLIENSIFSFYPNPVSDIITIDLVHNTADILTIYDISGSVVYVQEISNRSTEIGLSTLSQGIYFLVVGNKVEKFIKF